MFGRRAGSRTLLQHRGGGAFGVCPIHVYRQRETIDDELQRLDLLLGEPTGSGVPDVNPTGQLASAIIGTPRRTRGPCSHSSGLTTVDLSTCSIRTGS